MYGTEWNDDGGSLRMCRHDGPGHAPERFAQSFEGKIIQQGGDVEFSAGLSSFQHQSRMINPQKSLKGRPVCFVRQDCRLLEDVFPIPQGTGDGGECVVLCQELHIGSRVFVKHPELSGFHASTTALVTVVFLRLNHGVQAFPTERLFVQYAVMPFVRFSLGRPDPLVCRVGRRCRLRCCCPTSTGSRRGVPRGDGLVGIFVGFVFRRRLVGKSTSLQCWYRRCYCCIGMSVCSVGCEQSELSGTRTGY